MSDRSHRLHLGHARSTWANVAQVDCPFDARLILYPAFTCDVDVWAHMPTWANWPHPIRNGFSDVPEPKTLDLRHKTLSRRSTRLRLRLKRIGDGECNLPAHQDLIRRNRATERLYRLAILNCRPGICFISSLGHPW